MRDPIVSTSNPLVKTIRWLLRSAKQRSNQRMFVVEGVRLVAEALAHGTLQHIVYVPEQLATTPRGTQLLNQLQPLEQAIQTTPAVLQYLSDVETPQGVIGVAPWPDLDLPQQLSLVLMLDAVQDPGNVGTLLRSAEAAGADCVMCLPGTADIWSAKVVRAAMGTHFRLPLVQLSDITAAQQLTAQLPWYTAELQATQHYDHVNWQAPCVIIVGNEARGISETVAAHSSALLIPMHGLIESLNAAIAGSIILFEAARQRRNKRA